MTQDLRPEKTKAALRQGLLTLLADRPLTKVTVVALAQLARINKSTFYLHYRDIYDLYQQMVVAYVGETIAGKPFYGKLLANPEAFVRGFFGDMGQPADSVGRVLFSLDNIAHVQNLFALLIAVIMEQVYAESGMARTPLTDQKLQFLIGGCYGISLFRTGPADLTDTEVDYLVQQIKTAFPKSDSN